MGFQRHSIIIIDIQAGAQFVGRLIVPIIQIQWSEYVSCSSFFATHTYVDSGLTLPRMLLLEGHS